MNEYHKITTVFKRNMGNPRYLLDGVWAKDEFEYLKDNQWAFTEKVDGTNIRVMFDGLNVSFGGRTDDAQMPISLLNVLQGKFDTTPKRQRFRELFLKGEEETAQVCLYGEGYGQKIQKAGVDYKADGQDFVLFDIKIGNVWLRRADVEGIAEALGIKTVPIVATGTLTEAIEMVKTGFNSQWGEFTAEGLVCRPVVELKNRMGDRVITKIKYRDFERT